MLSKSFFEVICQVPKILILHGLENLRLRREGDNPMGLKGGVLVGTIGGFVGGVVNLIVELYWIRQYSEPI